MPGASRASRPVGGCAAPNAMKTLPIAEACSGMRTPGQLPAPSGWALSNSFRRVTPPGSGIAMFAVSPVSRRSRSRNGAASSARSATLVSRRAYSISTRPGRKPPLGPRWARPLRSSARSRRAAVLFESPVRSMIVASETYSSLSIRPTRMRAARSIAWVPSSSPSKSHDMEYDAEKSSFEYDESTLDQEA